MIESHHDAGNAIALFHPHYLWIHVHPNRQSNPTKQYGTIANILDQGMLGCTPV
jgi:hypothetical protein